MYRIGHLDVGVPGQLLGLRQGGALSQQFGDVSVPSRGMKIGKAVCGLVGDAPASKATSAADWELLGALRSAALPSA